VERGRHTSQVEPSLNIKGESDLSAVEEVILDEALGKILGEILREIPNKVLKEVGDSKGKGYYNLRSLYTIGAIDLKCLELVERSVKDGK
jgi:hypothetical protein